MSVDIHFEQLSNVWAVVHCEPNVIEELSSYFSFDVPNAKFSPQFKAKRWNGKVYLFSRKTRKIHAGLCAYVEAYAKDKNYTFSKTLFKGSIPELPKKEHLDHWKLPLVPRDYQWLGFFWAIINKRALFLSATSSGKSLLIYMISRWLLEHGKKRGLLIVPNTQLVEQMYSDFSQYGWDVDKNVQRIYEGYTKDAYAPLVCSTWQSIFELDNKYFSQFDFVIADECHQLKADSLKSIMQKLENCDYRIGTTGTLDGTNVNKLIIEGLTGPVKKIATSKDLMDKKQIAELEIKCLILQYPKEISNQVKGLSYQDEIQWIVANERRNKFITDLAQSLTGNTLILFNFVEKHGKPLYKIIEESLANTSRQVFFISGEVETEAREEIRRLTETQTDAIIVGSFGCLSTGVSIKRLHNVIFASPTKSQIRTLQSIGRGLRLGEQKDKCILYDIVDDLRVKDRVNFALKHYEERFKIYNSEKFNIKTINIGLKYDK